MTNVTLVGNKTVLINARQAVLDTGSSVITASTVDANTINSVSPHLSLLCVEAPQDRRCCGLSRPPLPHVLSTQSVSACYAGLAIKVHCSEACHLLQQSMSHERLSSEGDV